MEQVDLTTSSFFFSLGVNIVIFAVIFLLFLIQRLIRGDYKVFSILSIITNPSYLLFIAEKVSAEEMNFLR